MNKVPLLVTGLNGLVGSRLRLDFAERYEFDNLDLAHPNKPTDITDEGQVLRALSASAATSVVHFAAYTDVTGAWQQSGDKDSLCYRVNVLGTENLVKACAATGKHLVHISTAYVFDGAKEGLYDENDQPKPIEWYGQTKALAEEVVMNSEIDWTILRIDQPFRADEFPKVDTLHRIITGLRAGTLHPQFNDHYFGPTYINDFVKVIDLVLRKKLTGLYHASSGEKWSDFEFAKAVAEILNIEAEVKAGSLTKYLETSQRPYQRNTALSIDKLRAELDFELKTVREAIGEVENTNNIID